MGVLQRWEREPEARSGAGGGSESAWYSGGTSRARAPRRGENPENSSSNGNRVDGPVRALRGALAGERNTAGGAVN